MKNSLFRIDRNSVAAEPGKAAGFVVLPCLDEMMQQVGMEDGMPPAADGGAFFDEEEKKEAETEEEIRQRELRLLEEEIKRAKSRAEAILCEAGEQAEKIKQEAGEEGYAAGLAKASSRAEEERAQEKKSLAGALTALCAAADDLYAEMENGVLDLALYIAEHILKTEIKDNDDAYKNMVQTMLVGVRNQSNIVLKVSKEEFERFFADQEGEMWDVLKNTGITVVQDISLKSGNCFVETEFGYMDAGILTQLKRLEYSMKEFGNGR